ncbi:hypothetical protein C5167_046617 [Papaver somniferum]|uniref:Peptidase S54 rhomboid domain-containing protein n=1 Tax=Papaver somniferum TaxID=3469 RepID=A0A4Y7LF34_PAPSO|nr:hypothetical protein C5167_046617 [Papaver somniferum]
MRKFDVFQLAMTNREATLILDLVEEEEGTFQFGLLTLIFAGAGANLLSWLVLPRNAVSLGASGAVFGLFSIRFLVMYWAGERSLKFLYWAKL